MMNWASWADFAAMGGYGLYVWGSFGGCALVLAVEVAALVARRRALKQVDAPNRSPARFASGAHEAQG